MAGSKISTGGFTNLSLMLAQRVQLMQSSAFFEGIAKQDCDDLAKSARRRMFVRGEMISVQGQPFASLIVLESGCVKLTQVNIDGLEVILALRGSGEVVNLPVGNPFSDHSSSVQVVTGCTTLTWTLEKLESAMRRLPRLNANIAGILALQLHDLQERYHDLAVQRVEVRLARLLINLARQFGDDIVGGRKLALSRNELAQMTGTTLFTVSRLVSYWGGLGLVSPSRGAVTVLQPLLLAKLVSYKGPIVVRIVPPITKVALLDMEVYNRLHTNPPTLS